MGDVDIVAKYSLQIFCCLIKIPSASRDQQHSVYSLFRIHISRSHYSPGVHYQTRNCTQDLFFFSHFSHSSCVAPNQTLSDIFIIMDFAVGCQKNVGKHELIFNCHIEGYRSPQSDCRVDTRYRRSLNILLSLNACVPWYTHPEIGIVCYALQRWNFRLIMSGELDIKHSLKWGVEGLSPKSCTSASFILLLEHQGLKRTNLQTVHLSTVFAPYGHQAWG